MGVEAIIPAEGLIENSEIDKAEKCGVIGVYAARGNAVDLVSLGLKGLQHRGQENAGFSTIKNGQIQTITGAGLIDSVFTAEIFRDYENTYVAIGHNRYSTVHGGVGQPIDLSDGRYQISLAHNGNEFNLSWGENLSVPENPSDTTYMTAFLLSQRPYHKSWLETFQVVLPIFDQSGAHSLTMLTKTGDLWAVKGNYDIRPLVLGKLRDGWMFASESIGLSDAGADFIRDVLPGEIIQISPDGELKSFFYGEPTRRTPCLLEHVYFSRPDSITKGRRMQTDRRTSGKLLAARLQQKQLEIEVVIPVLESGLPATQGVAKAFGLDVEDAIKTSHYVGRTFIRPGNEERRRRINGKHNVIPDNIRGKKVVVGDDSGVRLNTSKDLDSKLDDSGTQEVHFAFASPPVVNPCDLGVDMRTSEELPASKWKDLPLEQIEENAALHIGADSVTYLPIAETTAAFGGTPEDFCYHCFGGPHPVRDFKELLPQREKPIEGQPRVVVFISGSGTNLQKLIDGKENGSLDMEIVGVLANKDTAYGLERAAQHGIEPTVIPSKGRWQDSELRRQFENEIFEYVQEKRPDVIVLAGWMAILGDDLLTQLFENHITVINLHPALLPQEAVDEILTSRGTMPVLRGAHAIKDAFEQSLPVSGVTVHQVLPHNMYDVGPILLQEEVHRDPDDTLETWEAKIHATEYRVLPTALNRVIHYLIHNIDPSQGTVPW